jgi:hypothetical protein
MQQHAGDAAREDAGDDEKAGNDGIHASTVA